MSDLNDFAEKYFSEHTGKSVPLDLLLAWLSENHAHGEDGTAIVPSMDLHRWAIKNAADTTVTFKVPAEVAEKIGGGMMRGMSINTEKIPVGPTTSDTVAAKEIGKVYPKISATTGREHMCLLPPEETCYWSGDPYAPHEMGF